MDLEPCGHMVEFYLHKFRHCNPRHTSYYEALGEYFANLAGMNFCFWRSQPEPRVIHGKPKTEKKLQEIKPQPKLIYEAPRWFLRIEQ